MTDARWMGAALALAARGRGQCAPNPNVGCVIVRDGLVVGRGWTQPGGRPHAEAMALAQAGDGASGATAFVTLEPCAHDGGRGPPCAASLIDAGIARVVVAIRDPDPRTDGKGIDRLRAAGIEVVEGVRPAEAEAVAAGFFTRKRLARPHVTIKLALSLDGRIALEDGTSKWITGPAARAHAHLERARAELIVVGQGTRAVDDPALDVRLPGLEGRSPRRAVLSTQPAASNGGWETLSVLQDIADFDGVDHVLVEGGGEAAAAFLAADLVDRLVLHRAPILIGEGRGVGKLRLPDLAAAHARWQPIDARALGSDRLEVYERVRS